MNDDEIEIAITKLEAIFEEKDNMTGLDICESARISLNVKGELSPNQMSWLKRNMKIHRVEVCEKEECAEEINEMFEGIYTKLRELEELVSERLDQ